MIHRNEQIKDAREYFAQAKEAANAGETNTAIVHLADGLDRLALGMTVEAAHTISEFKHTLTDDLHLGGGNWCR